MKLKYCLIYLILLSINLKSQENQNNPHLFGLNFGISQIFNNSKVPLIAGSTDCGFFADGKSLGYNIGLIYYYPIFVEGLYFSGGLNFDSRPARLLKHNSDFEVLDPFSNSYTPLKREFVLNSSLTYINLEFGFRYKLPLDFPFYTRLFCDFGNPLVEKSYSIKEQIISPEGVLFPDERRERTISEGKLNTSTTAIGINGALQYEFKLRNNLYLIPEISYRYGLNSILSDNKWDVQGVRLAFQILTDFSKDNEPSIPEPEVIPILIDTTSEVIAEIPQKITLIESVNSEPIYITETIVTQSYPLLPYIFFDSASADLPVKYIFERKQHYSEDELPKSTMEIYYRLLDIIGNRLINNPKSSITIIGATDGFELPAEKERLALAEQRALNIKNYLKSQWGVRENQLKISSRNTPSLPTSLAYAEGYEENRRVEIQSDDFAILSPVVHKKFLEYELLSNYISVHIQLNDYEDVTQNLNIYCANRELLIEQDFKGGSYVFRLDDTYKNKLLNQIKQTDELIGELTVSKAGVIEFARFPIRFEKQLFEYEIGRLNLIVFDFDKAELSDLNQKIIKHFLQQSIKPYSKIKIIGSTDRLGTDSYNLELSKNRAMNVRSFISNFNSEANFESVVGIGASSLYDNNTTEGRFYCRTVLIEIKTPIKIND